MCTIYMCVCVCVCVCVFFLAEVVVAVSPQAGSDDVETSCWAPKEEEETIKQDSQRGGG